MSDTSTLKKVVRLVAPIVSDLHLDLYDLEFRGGTLRVTIDTPGRQRRRASTSRPSPSPPA